MAGAIIVIDQPGGAGAGSPGVARNDLWQNKQINLSCATANGKYQWDLLDVPPGSGASLVGEGTSTPNFLPDLIGTYRIQLITNGGGPGNVQILIVRVRYGQTGVLQNRGWAPPAVGEQAPEANYDGNTRGWAEQIEFILADIRTTLVGPAGGDLGGSFPNPTVTGLTHVASNLTFTQLAAVSIDIAGQSILLGASSSGITLGGASTPVASAGPFTVLGNKVAGLPTKIFVQGVAGRQQTAQTVGDEVGALVFDPSALFAGNAQVARTLRFVAVLECGVGGQTCSLELYNLTDNVTVATLTASSTVPSIVTSALTVPGDLPNSQKLYTLRLSRVGGSSSDFVTCKSARLEVIYS